MSTNMIDFSKCYLKDNDPLFLEEDTSSTNTPAYELSSTSTLETATTFSETVLFKEASHVVTLLKLKLSKLYLEWLYGNGEFDVENLLPGSSAEQEWKSTVGRTTYADDDIARFIVGGVVMKECDAELSLLESVYKISKRDLLLKFL